MAHQKSWANLRTTEIYNYTKIIRRYIFMWHGKYSLLLFTIPDTNTTSNVIMFNMCAEKVCHVCNLANVTRHDTAKSIGRRQQMQVSKCIHVKCVIVDWHNSMLVQRANSNGKLI